MTRLPIRSLLFAVGTVVSTLALGCGGDAKADDDACATDDCEPLGSTTAAGSTTSAEPESTGSSGAAEESGLGETGPDGTTSGGGPSTEPVEPAPYGPVPDCREDETILSFDDTTQMCSPACFRGTCPDPGIEGLTPACAVTVDGAAEPSHCMLLCDAGNDTCPDGTQCEVLGSNEVCVTKTDGSDPSGGGDPTDSDDTQGPDGGGCAEACGILIACDFSGPVSLLSEEACVAECEANLAAQPAYCEPRLESFLSCVSDEACFSAESSCTISSSQFQVCLL